MEMIGCRPVEMWRWQRLSVRAVTGTLVQSFGCSEHG